jgi:protein O-mannosyl-transferase
MQRIEGRWAPAAVCLLLFALVGLVFGQAARFEFVNYDDPDYVLEQRQVRQGLSWANVQWAFTNVHARNWHPLTTLSHMTDVQLFGLNAGAHHLTSVAIHAAAAALLFLLFHAMTGTLWRSAFLAALFAIHPLRAESVAWVAERKDVLSGLFFVLTLLAYQRYVARGSVVRYLLVLVCFAAGLLSKPMLVTVPFLLWLLDFWPFRRWQRGGVWRLLLEKVPLIAMAAAASVITYVVQATDALARTPLPIGWRMANAVVSYVAYLRDTFWPTRLAPFYPHPEGELPLWQVGGAVLLLLFVTLCAVVWRRAAPYLFTGWFWFLGMLVPVIGVVEAGAQSRADRYTYLPQIGILLIVVWGASHLRRKRRLSGPVLVGGCAAVLVLLAWRAVEQVGYWRDSATLWQHALSVTRDNHVAHNNLGELAYRRGDLDAAMAHYDRALAIRLTSRIVKYDFLLALYHNNRAAVLQQRGNFPEALKTYERALELQPDYGAALLNYGGALAAAGQLSDAREVLQSLARSDAENAEARSALGTVLLQMGREREAVAEFERAIAIDPAHVPALNNATWLRAMSSDPAVREPARAVQLAEQALSVAGDDPMLLHKVAAAYAASGDFAAATRTAERALQLANGAGDAGLRQELERNLARYRAGEAL